MRKFILLLLLILIACSPLGPLPAGTPEASPTPSTSFSVNIHPDGPLYVGDQVSFEVFSPSDFQSQGQTVRINLADIVLAEKSFEPFGVGGRSQATFYWVWDTRELQAGDYTLEFTLLPDGSQWSQVLRLGPAAELPAPSASWKQAETTCCLIHYISGTDAETDLETLKSMLADEALDVESRLGAKFEGKIPVTFLPRTLGHGGFASDGIYVSYLRRNYAGGATRQVTHHEMVHWLDNQMGGEQRPSILQEGLAVYMSDGHFKVEPILSRGAALLELGWYIPLRQLADAFYTSQHEIGYAQAAALISYMVSTYGWERFNTFYRDLRPAKTGSQADALEAGLQIHFGLSLAQLEADFKVFLKQQPLDDVSRRDMRLSVAFYDSVRRYQRLYDPSAHFLTAWLPDVPSMRQRDIVADFLRHPQAPPNLQIENMLVAADAALRAGDYDQTETQLRAINILLDLKKKPGSTQ